MKRPFMAYSMARAYATGMMMTKRPFHASLLAVALLSLPLALHAQKSRQEQESIYEGTQNGSLKPLREIENGIVPDMKAGGADYIGQEFDPTTRRYRLKFMRGPSVIWVDVDGRTGAIVGRAGG